MGFVPLPLDTLLQKVYITHHKRKELFMTRIYKCFSCRCEIVSRDLDNGTVHNEPPFYSILYRALFTVGHLGEGQNDGRVEICVDCFRRNAPKDMIEELKRDRLVNVGNHKS